MSTEWLIFDASNASNIYGNPSYAGYLGMPNFPVGITINSIYFGRNHAVGLSTTGALYGWGTNSRALGSTAILTAPAPYPEPVLLEMPTTVTSWKAVATADNATIALTSAGAVWMTGTLGGELYLGWKRVSNFSSVTETALDVSCGLDHCIVLTTSGLYGIGANDQNQALPVISIGPTPTPPSSALITILTRIELTELTPGVSIAPAPGVAGSLPQFCTGERHTSVVWKGLAFIWGSCSSTFNGVCTASTYGIWMPAMTPISGNIFQLGCGKTHTVLRTGVSTYAIGGNNQNQVSSTITGFVNSWTDLFSSRGGSFGFNPFVIAGDLTLGRNNRLGTTFVPNNLLATFAGLISDEGETTPEDPAPNEPFAAPPVAAFTNTTYSISAFKRPSWLRLRRIDAAFGSSIRSTLAVRFREDDGACKGERPWPTMVCAPSLLNTQKSGWISQRSLSLTSTFGLNATLTLPGTISIVGQLWTDPAITITIPYSDMEAFPAIAVSQCAQIQSRMNVGIDPEAFDEVKKKPGRKVSFPLVQAGCRMFRNDDLTNNVRDDGSLADVTGEMYVVDWAAVSSSTRREGAPEVHARLVRSPGFVYEEFTSSEYIEKRTILASPDSDAYTTPGVPDNSIPPSNPASAESSNTTVGLTLTKSSDGDTLKNCQKRSISSSQQTSGSTTQLIATMAVENDGCNTWWIILVSVVCGVVLLVIIVIILVFAVPPIRRRVLPYKGSRS